MSNTTQYPLRRPRENPLIAAARHLFSRLAREIHRFRTVNELEKLSDSQLRDIGVDRRQIEEIAERELARLRTK